MNTNVIKSTTTTNTLPASLLPVYTFFNDPGHDEYITPAPAKPAPLKMVTRVYTTAQISGMVKAMRAVDFGINRTSSTVIGTTPKGTEVFRSMKKNSRSDAWITRHVEDLFIL